MIKSMSGHGRAEATDGDIRVTVEVRSVNHRFCRVSLRLPAELGSHEDRLRRQVQDLVQRGKVDVAVMAGGAAGAGAGLDRAAAAEWATTLTELAAEQGLAPPTLADVVAMPGVLGGEMPLDDDVAGGVLLEATAAALQAFDEMRGREGEDLAADLHGRVAAMRQAIEEVASVADSLPARVRDHVRDRITELLADTGVAPVEERIVQEAAHYAERADVTEEIVRLRSHLDKIVELLGSGGAVGRTLEFVTQEIHRELNTIGSKTKDLEVADTIVGLKAELERVREQVQNVE